MSSLLDADLRARLFAGPLDGLARSNAARPIASLCTELAPGEHPLSATLYIDAQLSLVDDMLHYYDRTSMAHSLEVRVPFLDHELVELCATIPPELKVRGTKTKYILKRAADGVLPKHIIQKRKIGFFSAGNRSAAGWVEAHAEAAFEEYLFDPAARCGELVDKEVVRELLTERTNGKRTTKLLLSLLMLEIWLSAYLPRALSTSTSRTPRQLAGDAAGENHDGHLVRAGG
jgi:asparagine synthase (glutamine-hydrolysing)